MRILTNIFLPVLLLFSLASCSNRPYQVLFTQKGMNSDTISAKTNPNLGGYRIKPQDMLQIRNLQNMSYIVDAPTTSGSSVSGGGGTGQTYQVDDDGTVALPVIGHIAVAGLTRAQAAKLVENLYRKSLLKDPIIELKIANQKVTLLGEFTAQGNFPLVKDRTTLVEMIGQAGGLSKNANETNIKIIRGDQKNPDITFVNLRDIESINDPKAILLNGDIVYVSPNKRAIRNENLQNVSSLVQPVLLLINTALLIISFSHR